MKRIAFPTVLLAGIAAVTACSGDDGEPARAQTTRDAATAPLPTSAAVAPVALPKDPDGLVATIGRQIKAARTVHADVTTTASGGEKEQASGDIRTDSATPAARLQVTQSGTTHAVVLDGVIYARAEGTEFEPGKPWCRLSRREIEAVRLEPIAKALIPIVDGIEKSLGEISSDTGLSLVKNGKFTKGPAREQLNGVAVHRYEGTTVTSAMPGAEFERMNAAGLKEIPWTLWVDDKGLPHKYTAALLGKDRTNVTTVVTYSRWGSPVSIQAPPANQVATLQ